MIAVHHCAKEQLAWLDVLQIRAPYPPSPYFTHPKVATMPHHPPYPDPPRVAPSQCQCDGGACRAFVRLERCRGRISVRTNTAVQ